MIIRNSIICNRCEEEIESTHVHDFRYCPCGAIAVDGGRDYLRRYGKGLQEEGYTENSIEEEEDGTIVCTEPIVEDEDE